MQRRKILKDVVGTSGTAAKSTGYPVCHSLSSREVRYSRRQILKDVDTSANCVESSRNSKIPKVVKNISSEVEEYASNSESTVSNLKKKEKRKRGMSKPIKDADVTLASELKSTNLNIAKSERIRPNMSMDMEDTLASDVESIHVPKGSNSKEIKQTKGMTKIVIGVTATSTDAFKSIDNQLPDETDIQERKQKRGRPKMLKDLEILSVSGTESADKSLPDNSNSKEMRRKRGRPKLQKTVRDISINCSEFMNGMNTKIGKRKRGRPKMLKDLDDTSASGAESIENLKPDDSNFKEVKQKRGRPKIPKDVRYTSSDTESNDSTLHRDTNTKDIKRKRGRPKLLEDLENSLVGGTESTDKSLSDDSNSKEIRRKRGWPNTPGSRSNSTDDMNAKVGKRKRRKPKMLVDLESSSVSSVESTKNLMPGDSNFKVVKRKRGRPKIPKDIRYTSSDTESNDSTLHRDPNTKDIKRKRGRPKLLKDLENSLMGGTKSTDKSLSDDSNSKEIRRKRGRPKLQKAVRDTPGSRSDSTDDMNAKVGKHKRRKPKMLEDLESSSVSSMESTENLMPGDSNFKEIKRKGGRPKIPKDMRDTSSDTESNDSALLPSDKLSKNDIMRKRGKLDVVNNTKRVSASVSKSTDIPMLGDSKLVVAMKRKSGRRLNGNSVHAAEIIDNKMHEDTNFSEIKQKSGRLKKHSKVNESFTVRGKYLGSPETEKERTKKGENVDGASVSTSEESVDYSLLYDADFKVRKTGRHGKLIVYSESSSEESSSDLLLNDPSFKGTRKRGRPRIHKKPEDISSSEEEYIEVKVKRLPKAKVSVKHVLSGENKFDLLPKNGFQSCEKKSRGRPRLHKNTATVEGTSSQLVSVKVKRKRGRPKLFKNVEENSADEESFADLSAQRNKRGRPKVKEHPVLNDSHSSFETQKREKLKALKDRELQFLKNCPANISKLFNKQLLVICERIEET